MRRHAGPIGFAALALALVVVPLTADNEYELRLFMLFLIYGVIAVGLQVLVGLAGLVSLGQAGLFAVGTYTAAILATRYGFDLAASSLAAVVMGCLSGVLLAYPTVRVRGVYLAVVTIAFGVIVENIAIEAQGLTGGTTGITGIPKPSLFGLQLGGYQYYGVLAGSLFATAVFAYNLKRSRYGRAMLAVAQSETAARSVGINPTAVRTLAFVTAAGTAALAGSFYAFLNSYVSPDIFTFSDSVRFLLMVIFGGSASGAGAIVGAYLLTYLPEYLQQFQQWQQFVYGLLLALVMFLMPRGLAGTAGLLWDRFAPPSRPEETPVAANLDGLLARTEPAELVAEDVTVRFGGLTALADASFRLGPGEIHALIGPNGAGKSTFVNTVTGFYRPDAGRIELDGRTLLGLRPHSIARSGLARTFQNTELFGELTVIENVMLGYQRHLTYGLAGAVLRLPAMRAEERRCRETASALLAHLGITPYADAEARTLPFGLQRRLEIARALATMPKVLLLDEPAAGLTAAEIDALEVTIRGVAALGISVLLIEHHVELIMAVADRVTVLDYGQVIASERPEVVQRDPRVIEAYLGIPAETAAALAS